ncbi:MAG TPA: PIN domain-containing protein [Actinophytocola sp.]|uniref:PIN domain-containing protein n=1 Tax=Actinophytocola sp. TaxID=1872138 RepID=UPI002DDCA83C|nr:PIN domain-containing protein [Actinophytocola sp.]HEV2781919.1 PIN domain-containing protein [Actinophytocola sp.]
MNLTFVDTNVLVYAHDPDEGPKHETAVAVLKELWRTGTGVLSTQVLQEFYSVVTRKRPKPMAEAEARERVAAYGEWCSMNTDPQLIVSASVIDELHSVEWWDALIIEGAMRSGATTLLSENTRDGRRFGLLTVRNPFGEN